MALAHPVRRQVQPDARICVSRAMRTAVKNVCLIDARTPKDWTPLSYCKAKGKYGATEEKGIYPEVRSQCPHITFTE